MASPTPVRRQSDDGPRSPGTLVPIGTPGPPARAGLLIRGRRLELATLAWNIVGIVVLAGAALSARSVALAGFALDSLIEIGASVVVLRQLADVSGDGQGHALRLIGGAFVILAVYLTVQSTVVLAVGYHPHASTLGIIWTAATTAVMVALAAAKMRTGTALGHRLLQTEARVTLIDGVLAAAILAGLVVNAAAGWWWADPAAAYVLVVYGSIEARQALSGGPRAD